MKSVVLCLIFIPAFCLAKTEKVNWTPCQKELAEYCTTYTEDIEKHHCLEDVPKQKLSKECLGLNKKLDEKFGHDESDKNHKH